MYRFKGHCSKTGTPKDMVGVPVLKLWCQWPLAYWLCRLCIQFWVQLTF